MNVSSPPPSGLTPERLQMFIAGLTGLPAEEIRKAKLLFIRNELAQLRALQASYESFADVQGCFALIPIFWPVLKIQRATMNANLNLHRDQIHNALTVWRDDLGAEGETLAGEVANLWAKVEGTKK
jgi:hypothetical protein